VQHILASTFAPRCVVWDLRKNEPIIKLTDSTSRVSITSNSSLYILNYDHSNLSLIPFMETLNIIICQLFHIIQLTVCSQPEISLPVMLMVPVGHDPG